MSCLGRLRNASRSPLARPFCATPASGIASAIRVSAIIRGGQLAENRQGCARRADAQPLAGSVLIKKSEIDGREQGVKDFGPCFGGFGILTGHTQCRLQFIN